MRMRFDVTQRKNITHVAIRFSLHTDASFWAPVRPTVLPPPRWLSAKREARPWSLVL